MGVGGSGGWGSELGKSEVGQCAGGGISHSLKEKG